MAQLRVVLPEASVEDFVWTWYSECMIQDHVLRLLQENDVSGYEVKPVQARFAKGNEAPPKLWELVVTGWGGMAPPESGITLDQEKSCSVCGMLRYTGLADNSKLIRPDQWDGSDIFMVWPLPMYIFITDRVRQLIESRGLSGCRFVDPLDMGNTEGFGPGRLSYYMPDARAKELGGPLGIY